MWTVSRIVAIAIAFLYVYVINKAVAVYYNEEAVTNINCFKNSKGSPYGFTIGGNYDKECGERKKMLRKSINNSKFMALTVAGLVAIAVGFMAKHPEFKISAALGGLLSIIWATWLNWDHFNDMARLGMTGVTLVALVGMLLKN